MSKPTHSYATRVLWEGNLGEGTSGYACYSRTYRVVVAGKPDLPGTADPAFRGEGDKHNPEELFLTSIAACHMLFYLALCAKNGVRVVAYEDEATGTMALDPDGGGRFEAITLRPRVTIARAQDEAAAVELHADAHRRCFIANSCATPIRRVATVRVRNGEERA
jgi:organic hydroperoxide reductase OsmC/OhrA